MDTIPVPDPTIVPHDQPEDMVLAMTLWGEARSQGDDVRIAKGSVINNRKLAATLNPRLRGLYGDGTIKSVCLAPLQFSCWNLSDPNRVKMLEPLKYHEAAAWEACYRIADLILRALVSDPTMRSTHYHDYAFAFDTRVSWANDPRYKWIMDISGTHFFRDTKAFVHDSSAETVPA